MGSSSCFFVIHCFPSESQTLSGSCKIKFNYKETRVITGTCLASPVFTIGGHCWDIRHYNKGSEQIGGELFYLSLLCGCRDVRFFGDLKFGKKERVSVTDRNFRLSEQYEGSTIYRWLLLEGKSRVASCVVNDWLTIECSITTMNSPCVSKAFPSLCDHLGQLLSKEDLADVTFEVKGKLFKAHKLVLAARSPIFKAQLFGSMNESSADNIKIMEIEPEVFDVLLHFIYSDTLPDFDSPNKEGDQPVVFKLMQHLLVAADRYGLDKLRLLCEEKLIKDLSTDTVATTLTLAEQHCFATLKANCLNFATESLKNFHEIALTEGYGHLLVSCPAIINELKEKLNTIPNH